MVTRAVVLGLAFSAGAAGVAACSSSGSTGSSSSASSASSSSSSSSSSGSSGSSSGSSGSSSGSSGTSSGSSGTSGSSSGDPVAACLSTCESMHPKGVALGKGIDTCWAASCSTQCNGIGTGNDKPPTTGMCKTDVLTPSAECSQCTVDHCCAAWDACFQDADCTALNACSVDCYK